MANEQTASGSGNGAAMNYDKGMAVDKKRPGNHSNSGESGVTQGASVRSGLSMHEKFDGKTNDQTGHCTKGPNQRPDQPIAWYYVGDYGLVHSAAAQARILRWVSV